MEGLPAPYPVARDASGAAVHIDDWQHGHDVTCFGCGTDLIGHLPHDGIKPTAHFAHEAGAVCDSETALHKAAKAAFVSAHRSGALHCLLWSCPHCLRQTNSTDLGSRALTEDASPCDGVKSDVLATIAFGTSIAPPLAIEVVVAHDIEAETMDKYRAAGIDVLSFRPNWGTVGDLARGAVALTVSHRVGAIDRATCTGCQALAREKEEWAALESVRLPNQWGDLWIGMWRSVGRDVLVSSEIALAIATAIVERDQAWWHRWTTLWTRIGAQIIDAWWIHWHTLWVNVGVEYMRPFRWMASWASVWEDVGRQYAADAIERERKRRYDDDRRNGWWTSWIRLWKDIGQRESGAMAAWRPLCRLCRDDLRPDHQCPRLQIAVVL